MKKPFSLLFVTALLCSCQSSIPPEEAQDSDNHSNVGLDIEWATEETPTEEKTEENPSAETIDAVAELQHSYDAAIVVRDLMLDALLTMNEEQKTVVQNALDAFSADIDALKYYVDTATYDELTDDEHEELLKITKGIDDGIAVFGDILELVL